MAAFGELPFSPGEKAMHDLLHVQNRDNPTSLYLTPFAAHMLIRSPLLAVGALDSSGRPWTSIWGGEAGFSQPIAQSVIGVKTLVDRTFDPVLETLLGKSDGEGEVVKPEGRGKMVGGLAIDLETRKRVKLYGRMVAGALAATEKGVGEVQLVVKIEQSLGNCPKYLNKKHIVPTIPQPYLASNTLPLSPEACALIAKSDLFFISSSNHESDMDTNHRGGPVGFVRVLSNDDKSTTLVYPEYSGNRLYQTLGNLKMTPRAGLVFPDFDTGDVLYVTGTTEILAGSDADALLPRSNLAVKITLEEVRFVKKGLSFKGIPGELSPYNPPVRLLKTEQKHLLPNSQRPVQAKLLSREVITPNIARLRFHINNPTGSDGLKWKPGQYVALSFEEELDIGYSHMRDDDPKSLNDDYLRTFTVSSIPDSFDEFEITIRKVGSVTDFLFRHNQRMQLEVPLMGFGGEFFVDQKEGENVTFVAGGVGITPLLAQAPSLNLERLSLLWTVRAEDLGLVLDTLKRIPGLGENLKLFVTGAVGASTIKKKLETIKELGGHIETRRLVAEDLKDVADKVYLCTGPELRKALLVWLSGKSVVYEDFNY